MKLKYSLKGLDCANCAQKVQERVSKLENVRECSVVFATTKMFVETDTDLFDESKIVEAVKSVEPDVEVINLSKNGQDYNVSNNHEECNGEHDHKHHHDHEKCGCGHEHEHHHDHKECSCGHDHEHNIESVQHGDLKGAINIKISGLDCANCAMKVEQAINKMNEIDEAMIIFSTETLKVKPKTSIAQNELLKKLQKVVDQVEDDVTLTLKDEIKVVEKPKLFVPKEHLGLIGGTLVYIAGIIAGEFDYAAIVYGIAYLLVGYKVILKALKNIRRGEVFDENFLMCIATIGAFCISDSKEAIAVMLFYSVGEIFQAYAVNKTRTSISSLMDLKSDYANLLVGEEIKKVAPEEIKIGDEIIVKVGEKVPLDGVVLEGASTLDTSSLTGETLPRNVNKGDEVLAGVVNLTGIINLKVSQVYEDSTVSRILDLVENAASKKAPIEQFITRFARIYTPTVVFLAVALAIVPMLIFKDAVFTDWLYRALTFLVVSCPCALVISIPLTFFGGIGAASKRGVLVKGSNYLEALNNVSVIVFDKTGTLTKGVFNVTDILPANGFSKEQVLEYAAEAESFSNHPIAKSILAVYEKEIDQSVISDYKEISGYGISVMAGEKKVFAGNTKLMDTECIEYTTCEKAGTKVYLAVDGQYAGCILITDEVKSDSKKAISDLKHIGVEKTVMLTGDDEKIGKSVAEELQLDKCYAQLLPDQKVKKVELLDSKKRPGSKLAFVGDGINDAPVLARADVGIAMGGLGSDAAIEAADVVLMTDEPSKLVDAIEVAKATKQIVMQNIVIALGIKSVFLILGALGIAGMWEAVFGDVGVTIIAVLNAMRILKK